jgi:hypothetical protein
VENLLEYESWLNEGSLPWTQGGWVFIKGKPLKDQKDKSYVFLMSVKYVNELSRMKVGNKPGIPVYMANLYDEIHIIGYKDGKLSSKKVMPTEEYLQKWVGMTGFNIGLNKNKTPNWRNTITIQQMPKVMADAQYWLPAEPWAIIPTF